MNKFTGILSMLIFLSTLSFAQPPGGRPSGGDGNGRPGAKSSESATFDMETRLPKGNSKISGFVIDSAVTIAVEYATVSILDGNTGKVLDGTTADENGKFEFNKVGAGTYALKITFIGYQDKVVDKFKVVKGSDLDLGVIKLSVSARMLDEVTVTGLKNIIEEKVDRLVYNAENDVTSKGGDGADVLRKVPMLSVDLEGNVSLRGSSNIKVLINNKPSTIVASSVADALKMIPADLIKTVEVITSPSAKYDAEGTSGIINIITKRSSIQGYNLSLNTGVGLRGSNLGLNGNLRVGKFGFSLGGYGRAFYNKAGTSLNQTTFNPLGNSITKQTGDAKDFGMFGRYNLGVDYEINKDEYVTGSVSFGQRNFSRDQLLTTDLFRGSDLYSSQQRNVDSKNLSNNVDVNLDYVKIFKPSQEWSISSQFSQNNLTNDFNADIFASDGILLRQQKNINGNVNREITLQTDYTAPIKKNQMFEVGVKGIMREVNSDYRYLNGINGNFEADAFNPSGILDYNQNITSGYVSYTYSTPKKLSIKVGTRYEYTTIDAMDRAIALNLPSYGNLVPSINISQMFKNGTTIKVAYNNRIQRPGLQQLNPNFNAANPQDINVGNPNLKPEISNNVELSISKAIKRSYVNLSFFGRQTNNSILKLSMPSDTLFGALVTTYDNIGKQQTTGMNFFGNLFITPKWSINGGVDMYYQYLEGQVQSTDGLVLTNNDGIVVSGRLMSQLKLENGWSLQAFAGMRGNEVMLLGSQTGMRFYSVGFLKDFGKKASLGLGIDNIFGGMVIRSNTSSDLFQQESVNNIYNQNIKVNFSYKLGNMKFVEKKRTKSVNNTDVKAGGDNSQSM
ncbi:Outer membrane receptor proteins, mostly Fe transport [Spirosomataceae bacterium TFI 002]|nr:Outer membrane receptor proteins, mostly Fe transport [Spirosomataceae bacterium TFI 002]